MGSYLEFLDEVSIYLLLMRFVIKTLCLLMLAFCFGLAQTPSGSKSSLNMPLVKQAYADGNFDSLKTELEDFLKRSAKSATREELVLVYKILGVLHASREGGAAAAEAYFTRLLDLAPQVEIIDLYPPRSVNEFFQKLKQEHRIRSDHESLYDEFGTPKHDAPDRAKSTSDSTQTTITSGRTRWPWFALLGAAGIGVAAYLTLDAKSTRKTQEVSGGQ